jgi:hypothetical protein
MNHEANEPKNVMFHPRGKIAGCALLMGMHRYFYHHASGHYENGDETTIMGWFRAQSFHRSWHD